MWGACVVFYYNSMENIIGRNRRGVVILCLAAAAALGSRPLSAETLPLSTAPVVLQPAERVAAAGFKFNARAGETKGNIVFSPYGLYSAFSMVYDCARGNTAAEMLGVFGFPEDQHLLRREAVRLRRGLAKSVKGAEFRRVNAFWYQTGYEFLPEYEAVLKSSYSASGKTADFRTVPEKARAAVNDWTAKQTGGRISEIFEQGSLTQLTRLTLLSAVYFKGKWRNSFSSDGTSEQEFTLAGGEKVQAQLMSSVNPVKINYYDDGEVQVAGLDYLGGRLRMLVILPGPGKSAADLGRSLSPEMLAGLREALPPKAEPVIVHLPRFKFSSSWDLASGLSALGMPLAFAEAADLSGMTGRKGLFLQKAAQKVFVEVDEEGTGTAAIASKAGRAKRGKKPPVFRADRPFIFLIEEKRTGLILFMGRLDDPTAGV